MTELLVMTSLNSSSKGKVSEAFLRSFSHDHKEPIRSILWQIDKINKIQIDNDDIVFKQILNNKEIDFKDYLNSIKVIIENLGDEISEFREKSKNRTIFYEEIIHFIQEIEDIYLSEYDKKVTDLSINFKELINQNFSKEFTKLRESSSRLKRRFQGTKDYARANGKLSFTQFGLHNEVNRVIKELEYLLENDEHKVQHKIRIEGKAIVSADQLKIAQIFQNLIENSVRYAKKSIPRTITIDVDIHPYKGNSLPSNVIARDELTEKIQPESDYVYITLADDGRGIHGDDIPRIFNLYYRGANTSGNPNEVGTGTGLAIVKTIIDAHGGFIWVDSEVDSGTTFHILLPSG
jgi:signal transduction histidine kinase